MSYTTVLPCVTSKNLSIGLDRVVQDVLPESVSYTQTGREALVLGLTALSVTPNDKILLPATICEVVLQACVQQGVAIEYYDLDDELQPIWSDVERRLCTDVKALYINHYFGRTCDVAKAQSLCRQYDVALIEDCAHAFASKYNGEYVGGFGDISLFSLRKFFPIIDGGALRVNTALPSEEIDNFGKLKAALGLGQFSKSVILAMSKDGYIPMGAVKSLRAKVSRAAPEEVRISTDNIAPTPMTKFSSSIMRHSAISAACEARLSHYHRWASVLSDIDGVKPVFKSLPVGSVPFSFPILCDKRAALMAYCRDFGIYLEPSLAAPLRDVPGLVNDKEPFARLERLAENIISLPLHQSLFENNMDKLIAIVVAGIRKLS